MDSQERTDCLWGGERGGGGDTLLTPYHPCSKIFFLNTTQEQRDAARFRSSSTVHAGAFLTAIPVSRMGFGNDMIVVSVWQRSR